MSTHCVGSFICDCTHLGLWTWKGAKTIGLVDDVMDTIVYKYYWYIYKQKLRLHCYGFQTFRSTCGLSFSWYIKHLLVIYFLYSNQYIGFLKNILKIMREHGWNKNIHFYHNDLLEVTIHHKLNFLLINFLVYITMFTPWWWWYKFVNMGDDGLWCIYDIIRMVCNSTLLELCNLLIKN